MADVADGRLRPDAGPGAPFPDAAGGAGAGLWLRSVSQGDGAAVRRAGPAARGPRLRGDGGRAERGRFRDPRLGLAA